MYQTLFHHKKTSSQGNYIFTIVNQLGKKNKQWCSTPLSTKGTITSHLCSKHFTICSDGQLIYQNITMPQFFHICWTFLIRHIKGHRKCAPLIFVQNILLYVQMVVKLCQTFTNTNVVRVELVHSNTRVLELKGHRKCVWLYRMSEYSGFILVNRNTLWP
jgi:hypothetical protein